MHTLKLKYFLKSKVHIKELKRDGFIVSIYYGDTGLQYYVRYFDKAEAKTVYFYEEELTECQETEKIHL